MKNCAAVESLLKVWGLKPNLEGSFRDMRYWKLKWDYQIFFYCSYE